MTREMQDGINSDAAGMDHSIPLVAYYIDGRYKWTPAEIALFPHSVHVRIAVWWTTRDGHVIDRETGDATAAQAAAWAHQRRLDGFPWPTVYCSVSNQAEVIAAFNAIHEPMPLWWLAHYDNVDVLPAGAIAKQYADPGPLDKSVVADFWPGVDTSEVDVQFTDVVPPNPVQGTVGAALNDVLYGQDGVRRAGQLALDMNTVKVQLAALAGALPAEHADVLAAIQAVPVAQVDPAALEAAGLPAQIVAALLAAISKAATPAAPAITTGGSPA